MVRDVDYLFIFTVGDGVRLIFILDTYRTMGPNVVGS